MDGQGAFGDFFQRCKPYIAMISLQFGYAGMNIISKVSLTRGFSHYVLVVYRHAIATAVIAPFAIVLERKVRPKLTFTIFMQIFVLGLLGPVIDQNLYYAGLKLTSPTFSCAISNMLPAMTFVMAVICRMEKVHIRKLRCQAKVLGTIITVGGAMFMTVYKGSVINLPWTENAHHPKNVPAEGTEHDKSDWVMGSILLIIATLSWAAFFILQSITLKRYTAHISLTAFVCFMGTLQSIAVTLVMEHKPSAWHIGFDMNLLAAAYAGIVSSSIAYYVQGLVMQKRGPVFVTAFSPLMMIIVAIMGSFILAEKLYVGAIIGGVLIVMGLYSVLWGKYKEYKEKEAMGEIPEVVKCGGENGGGMATVMEEIDEDIEMQKKGTMPVVAVSLPIPQPPMIAVGAPKA